MTFASKHLANYQLFAGLEDQKSLKTKFKALNEILKPKMMPLNELNRKKRILRASSTADTVGYPREAYLTQQLLRRVIRSDTCEARAHAVVMEGPVWSVVLGVGRAHVYEGVFHAVTDLIRGRCGGQRGGARRLAHRPSILAVGHVNSLDVNGCSLTAEDRQQQRHAAQTPVCHARLLKVGQNG